MPSIHFISHDGTRRTAQAQEGLSLMRAAVDNSVPGIDGDCGGQCACGTCHVYIDAPWAEQLGAVDEREDGMLEFTDCRQGNSRLACQIQITPALDGLEVGLPLGQH
ncbi:MAG TPA: 2Fe-2S iron-sulfur cluster-binding protein [Variovorax sp.]|nr:2Fe-2S iron-sulfur cluster-binding protein [Variovorax sp.]